MNKFVVPLHGDERAVAKGGLQRPYCGRPDGDDATARRASLVEQGGGVGGEFAPFSMHGVIAQSLDADRPKRADADVQGHERSRNASLLTARSSSGVKCSPAVGAATAPGLAANVVWYRSQSKPAPSLRWM